MKQLMLLLFIVMISQFSFSQIEISGQVKDQNGPVSFANVVLIDSTKTIKTYDIADEKGAFVLETEKGKYTLQVSILGYQNWEKEVVFESNQILEDILLKRSTEELDEVIIKDKKPLIERKPDRLIFNVENSVAASGGNALEALSAAPGVNVENDGIGMIGRGASRVMINGRILQLSGEALVEFLNSIAADDIKKIEIITNPPAKYEAAGSGGLLNIIYKKGVGDFWKNSTTFAYNQNKYDFYTLRNNFLYNKNKIKLNISVNGDIGNERSIETVETRYPSGPWQTNLDVKKQKDQMSGRLLLDYDITKKTSIGIQYLGNFSQPDRNDRALTNILNNTNTLDSLFRSNGKNNREINSHIYNLHMISKIDTLGRKISVDLDYFDYENKLERDFIVNTFSSNEEFLRINQAQINLSDQLINNFSAKVDVEHPLKLIDLSYGAKLSFIKTENDLQNFNTITGTPELDTGLSNEFEYNEDIQALYVRGSKKINDKLQMQIGLRLENTITKGVSKTLNQTNKNDYLKLFPTFYVSYEKNENHNFSFNYGRRITRPSFRDLNPFRSFTNSNSFSEGNPFIQPSFKDIFEFNYTYKEVLTTNAFLNITSDGYGVLFTADPDNNIQAIIRRNYYDSYVGGIGEIYTFNKISWWESQNQFFIVGYKRSIDNDIDAITRNGVQLYVDLSNRFSLSKSTKLQLDFFYSSKYRGGLYENGERYGLDFGLRQNFLNNDLKLSLYFNDIFDTGSQNNNISEINGVEVVSGQNYSRRFFRFSLSYSFGNKKIRVKKRNFGNDDERQRAN
ncbi:outer membrane beta-barrel family protein [Aquimarina sp. AU119]|uniref:outer membrane beta-barrel family protein n=1 Tax=Aquimarina sp. AU119 TaxID=2108528 RepID=UPI000D69F45A|nr:outer membrane beta-barrel family protein [Aquimarina sp. AU119]